MCCSSKKRNKTCRAEELYYPSTLFRCTLNYLKQTHLGFEEIYILSAKYGLLRLDDVIEPYNSYLPDFTKNEYKIWVNKVTEQLSNLPISEAHFYTSLSYDKDLILTLEEREVRCERHLSGLGIGQKVHWLQQNTKKKGLF